MAFRRMFTNTATISNPSLSIKPSYELKTFISNIKVMENSPPGTSDIYFKNEVEDKQETSSIKMDYLITEEDKKFIESVTSEFKSAGFTEMPSKRSSIDATDELLSLQDLFWLHRYINKENEINERKVYLHNLMDGSDIILPRNEEVPTNKEFDKRCQKLRAEQENSDYHKMTKNVDCTKRKYPDDTIAYQMKQMNSHLFGIFQFILSVAAGFLFGFIGLELLTGSLDCVFRLLLGIICALIVAVAELYFLAKKLDEDLHNLQFKYSLENQHKNVRVN